MRSKRVTFRIPWPLYDEIDKLCSQQGFDDISAFLVAQCIMAIQNDRRRVWVAQIANSAAKQQDYLITGMLKWPTELKGMLAVMAKLDKDVRI